MKIRHSCIYLLFYQFWNYVRIHRYFPQNYYLHVFFRDIPEEVLNTYCWIHSTYTVLEMHTRHERGNDAAYPGVENSGKTPTKQLKYYQWVAFMLFFQVSYTVSRQVYNKLPYWQFSQHTHKNLIQCVVSDVQALSNVMLSLKMEFY